MDKVLQFRIDSIEATEKQGPEKKKSPVEPLPFQSYQLVSNDNTASAIDFRCLDGKRYGFSYAYLNRLFYNPDPANEQVVIYFSSGEVTVRGVNLNFIYERLLERKVCWIKEINVQLLERYQQLKPANDNLAQDIPVVVEFILNEKN